jgi:hypothetical protein
MSSEVDSFIESLRVGLVKTEVTASDIASLLTDQEKKNIIERIKKDNRRDNINNYSNLLILSTLISDYSAILHHAKPGFSILQIDNGNHYTTKSQYEEQIVKIFMDLLAKFRSSNPNMTVEGCKDLILDDIDTFFFNNKIPNVELAIKRIPTMSNKTNFAELHRTIKAIAKQVYNMK